MLLNNLKFIITTSFALMIPDFYLGYIKQSLTCSLPLINILCVILFTGILSFEKCKPFLYFLFISIAIFQAIQINHWVYFGAPIHSQDIGKIFTEFDEILLTGKTILPKLFDIWITWLISITLLIFSINKFRHKKNSKFATPLIIVTLAVTPILSLIKGPSFFYTKPTSSIIYNTTRAFSDCIANSNKNFNNGHQYKPYELHYTSDKLAKNIIVIMGESQRSQYMQLYGLPIVNTPFLESQKNNPNFAYAKGVSSSVYTRTCLQLFFNLIHNPGDVLNLRKKTANLFSIARKQGYHTIIISAQNEKLFHDTGTEFVDTFISSKDIEKQLKTDGDIAIIEQLKKQKLTQNNFIVLHLRHIHSPFTDYNKFLTSTLEFPANIYNKTLQEYINAISYNDLWLKQTTAAILELMPNDTVIIFTSDHGELIGERNLFGHNLMAQEVADVPMLMWDTNGMCIPYIKNKNICSHYDIGKFIAQIMGVTVVNHNEIPDLQFVHGSEFYKNYPYMPWKIEDDQVKFEPTQIVVW